MAEETHTEPKATVGHGGARTPLKRGQFWLLIGLAVIAALVITMLLLKNEPAPTEQDSFTPAATARVDVSATGFTPATIQVNKGTIVTWTNNDDKGHSVVANSGTNASPELKSDPLVKGQAYHYKFTKSGTYYYHDGQNATVNAVVVVK